MVPGSNLTVLIRLTQPAFERKLKQNHNNKIRADCKPTQVKTLRWEEEEKKTQSTSGHFPCFWFFVTMTLVTTKKEFLLWRGREEVLEVLVKFSTVLWNPSGPGGSDLRGAAVIHHVPHCVSDLGQADLSHTLHLGGDRADHQVHLLVPLVPQQHDAAQQQQQQKKGETKQKHDKFPVWLEIRSFWFLHQQKTSSSGRIWILKVEKQMKKVKDIFDPHLAQQQFILTLNNFTGNYAWVDWIPKKFKKK